MDFTPYKTTDTIYHLAETIKTIRNHKIYNLEALAEDNLEETYDEYFAVCNISDLCNYFIQFYADGENTLHCELSKKHPDDFKLSSYKKNELLKLGWIEPTKNSNLYPNYWKKFDVSDETACHATAAELVLTIIKIFDYRTYYPIEVTIDKWNNHIDLLRTPRFRDRVKHITRGILLYIADILEK